MIQTDLNIPIIKNAYVEFGPCIDNKIPIRLEVSGISNETDFIGQQLYAIVLNGQIPKPNDRGVVVYKTYNDKTECYWLGVINDPSKLIIEHNNTDDSKNTYSNNKKTAYILNDDNSFFGNINGGNFTSNNNYSKLSFNNNEINVTKNGINIDGGDAGKVSMQTSQTETFLNGLTHNIKSNVIFKIDEGVFQITGKIDPSKASSGNLNDPSKYLPNEGFFVNTKKILIKTSGIYNISASGYKLTLSSSKFAASGKTIGTGSDNTYDIDIVRGNAKIQVGQGNIEFRTNNFLLTDRITVMCGSIIHPINSGVDFSALEAKMTNRVVFGIDSTLSLSKASATLSAFKDITLQAKLGNATLKSMIQTIVESVLATKIKGLTVDIEGQVKTAIKTAMLDLQQSQMINTGPKIVTPGVGPLCGIPVCPFTGAIHGGSIAVG